MPRTVSQRSSRSLNVLAGCVSAASLFVLYASVDPVPAGEEIRAGDDVPVATASFEIVDKVPVPPEATVTPRSEEELADMPTAAAASESAPSAPAEVSRQLSQGAVLDNDEAIKFSLLLLREGAAFMQGVQQYSAVFTKQERLNGDLSESQTIDMKIQHGPVFSVYMKWRNGDTGRQLLYSDQYEDKQMVVKLGGLKGRLLPGIKLDPHGERALSESRYPVTDAGILGMVRQMILHREADLKRGYGVVCRRLPNQQFDERDCLCFSYEYESQEKSPMYRKSVVLIDSRHSLPMLARQFTWARDAEHLSPEELDQQTLIEHYSFSNINFDAKLAAEDFSRDNPRYRM